MSPLAVFPGVFVVLHGCFEVQREVKAVEIGNRERESSRTRLQRQPKCMGRMCDLQLFDSDLQHRTLCIALGVGQGDFGASESENVL